MQTIQTKLRYSYLNNINNSKLRLTPGRCPLTIRLRGSCPLPTPRHLSLTTCFDRPTPARLGGPKTETSGRGRGAGVGRLGGQEAGWTGDGTRGPADTGAGPMPRARPEPEQKRHDVNKNEASLQRPAVPGNAQRYFKRCFPRGVILSKHLFEILSVWVASASSCF